jgi:hypothetical protein
MDVLLCLINKHILFGKMGSCLSFFLTELKIIHYDEERRCWVNRGDRVTDDGGKVYDKDRRCWVKPET